MHLRYIKRIREILTVFFEEGFDIFVRKAQLHHHIPLASRWNLKKKESSPEKLRKALERLGPTFVKFGQTLSLRPDVLPMEYIKELEKMQDKVTPVPFSQIKQVIKSQFGKSVNELFSSFNKEPVASASLAQVYKAKLKNGKVVAVKVQRPNIDKIMKQDMEILHFLAQWADHRKVLPISITSIIDEFKRWTLRELNFHYEAANIKLVKDNFNGSRDVIIPKVYDDYSSEKVLTLEFIDGIPIHNVNRLRNKQNMAVIMRKTYNAVMEMVFIHGLFHADPHAGNILVCKNKVAFIDFGITGKLDQKLRRIVLRLSDAIVKNNPDIAVEAIIDMDGGIVDKNQLRRELLDVFEEIRLEKLKDIKLGEVLNGILEIIYTNKIKVPIDFVLFAKAIIILEGLGLRYSPNLRLLAETKPFIEKLVIRERSPLVIARRVEEKLKAYEHVISKTPELLLTSLEHISEGKVGIELAPKELNELRVELEHSSGNMAIGIMIAALAVSSALLAKAVEGPQIWGMPKISFIGFMAAVVLALWLVKRTVFIRGDIHGVS